jgi:hypothetical protein
MSDVSRSIRRKQLAAALAAAFITLPALAPCTSRYVGTCADDADSGTLRNQISAADPGDLIDLTGLACSTITLTAGEISTAKTLTLQGPANGTVSITTSGSNRLLHHTGAGYFYIYHLTFSGGYYATYDGNAKGGCIASQGMLLLGTTTLSGCEVYSVNGVAEGGAIYAGGAGLEAGSTVTGSIAYSVNNVAWGGGVIASLVGLSDSTISGNTAKSAHMLAYGGGAFVVQNVYVTGSTIDSNNATAGGGIFQRATLDPSTSYFMLKSSTVSGNSAGSQAGGIYTNAVQYVRIENSTVAFNSAAFQAGMLSEHSVLSESSIIAKNSNTTPGGFADLTVASGGLDPNGLNNLIQSYTPVAGLGVVTVTVDPRLAPLAWHGGKTRTHALSAGSPAIDDGNTASGVTLDQRGLPRDVPSGAPDIGAYERQADDDELFYSGFN